MSRNKPRKWSNLKGQIPSTPEPLSERVQKILKEKDERKDADMTALAQEWDTLEEEEEFEDLAREERSIKFEAIKRRTLEELAKVKQVAGTDMWRGEGHTFSPKNILNVEVHDPQALRQWIQDTGMAALLTIHVSRLKSLVGEAMNADLAAALTPAQRAALKPGDPGSMQAPPGVTISLFETVHHTSNKRKRQAPPEDPDGPF